MPVSEQRVSGNVGGGNNFDRVSQRVTKIKTVFPLGMTRKAKLLSIPPLVISIYMIMMGVSFFRSFHPADSSRYIYSLPPIAVALAILGVLFTIPRKMCQGRIELTTNGIEWDPGREDLNASFPWSESVISVPASPQATLRTLLVAYRDRKILLYDLFVPDFDTLVAHILKRKGRGLSNDVPSVKLESGRVTAPRQ